MDLKLNKMFAMVGYFPSIMVALGICNGRQVYFACTTSRLRNFLALDLKDLWAKNGITSGFAGFGHINPRLEVNLRNCFVPRPLWGCGMFFTM